MRVIIPAAGIGSRLRPHTLATPKPLLPVAGKPMLAHVLDSLKPLDPDEVIFVVGHHVEIVTDWQGLPQSRHKDPVSPGGPVPEAMPSGSTASKLRPTSRTSLEKVPSV